MSYQRGFIRTSTSGKFVGVLKYKDPAGQWRQVTKTFSRDRAESELAFARWRAEMGAGGSAGAAPPAIAPGWAPAGAAAHPGGPPDAGTVEQAVRECLAAQLASGRIERSTHDTQMAYAERHLFPEIGSLRVVDLSPALVQGWLDRLCLDLSPGSARIAFGVLRKACSRAAVGMQLPEDPCGRVEQPARARPSRAYLPDPSVALLEEAVAEEWGPGDGRACAVALALHAGLRAGECCALRWRDVDLAAGRLRVAASVGRTRGGAYLKGPKCPASAREFPIVAPLSRALSERAAAAGRADSHFVCGSGERFVDPRALSRAFAGLCEGAGVTDDRGRRATFHELRHTFATRAVRAGVDVRTLADLMGHSSADVTLNVYAASGEDAKLAAVAKLEGRHPAPERPYSGRGRDSSGGGGRDWSGA